jgi:hypothetical protein
MGRAQCRMPAAGCSCLVLLFDGSERRDCGFVCGGKSGEEGMDEGVAIFVLSDLVCCLHGPRIRGREVRAGLYIGGRA